jgi:hypothetical protein
MLGKTGPIDAELVARTTQRNRHRATQADRRNPRSDPPAQRRKSGALKAHRRTPPTRRSADHRARTATQRAAAAPNAQGRSHALPAAAARHDPSRRAAPSRQNSRSEASPRRTCQLDHQIVELDRQLERLTQTAAPRTLQLYGVGSQSARQLLITAGQNIDRLALVSGKRRNEVPDRRAQLRSGLGEGDLPFGPPGEQPTTNRIATRYEPPPGPVAEPVRRMVPPRLRRLLVHHGVGAQSGR